MHKLFIGLLLSLALTIQAAVAQQLPPVAQDFVAENLLTNAGFENGNVAWTASGGATKTVNTTAKGLGNYGYDWDSNSASQTLVSKAVTVPAGLQGRQGVAICSIKAASGTPTYTMTVNDGTNDLVTAAAIVTSTTQFTKNQVFFQFPTSGSVKIKLTSVASDEAEIYIDSCFLGDAFNVSQTGSDTDWADDSANWSFSAGFGTTSNVSIKSRRIGDSLQVRGYLLSTSPAASTIYFTMIGGRTLDTSKIAGNKAPLGLAWGSSNNSGIIYSSSGNMYSPFSDGSTNNVIYFSPKTGSGDHIFSSMNGTDGPAAPFGFHFEFTIPIANWGGTQQAVRLDTVNWRVDANISGANPALASTAQSAYVGIEDSGLTLANSTGKGIIAAQIPCSSTNAPSGTTCSAGNESVGVAFTLPAAGDVRACVSFSHNLNISSGNTYDTFEIVETPVNAQTITQEGKSRVQSGHNSASTTLFIPNQVCGTFTFASAGQKVLRLMYEQSQSAAANTNQIMGDAGSSNGQRDIHWEVYPLNQQVPAPILVGTGSTYTSQLRRTGGNSGIGSTNTAVMKWSTAVGTIKGTALSYTETAANGGYVGVSQECDADVTYTFGDSGSTTTFGIAVDETGSSLSNGGTTLAGNVRLLGPSDGVVATGIANTSNSFQTVHWAGHLLSGAKIWFLVNGGAPGVANSQFTVICRP